MQRCVADSSRPSALLNAHPSNGDPGMYSQQAWGGPVDPFILVKFTDVGKDQGDDPIVSLVIFEWKDESYIGVPASPDSYEKYYQCEPKLVDAGLCNSTDIGEFILTSNATAESNTVILTKAMHLKDSVPIKYPIKKTGYYCVLTFGYSTDEFEALVEFRNAYGELPAAQIPKLPFYGGISLLYALVSVFWGFLYFQHRSDICEQIFQPPSAVYALTSLTSGRAELHHGYPHLPCCRDADDMGILRYVLSLDFWDEDSVDLWLTIGRLPKQAWLKRGRQSPTCRGCRPQRDPELVLVLPPAYSLYGLRRGEANLGEDHDMGPMARHRPFRLRSGLCHH